MQNMLVLNLYTHIIHSQSATNLLICASHIHTCSQYISTARMPMRKVRTQVESTLSILTTRQHSMQVYCDMDTDGGGWTVILCRMDGSVNFNRSWSECEAGFGNLSGEYWLGLTYIHRLTASVSQELRVDLEDFENNIAYAHYSNFTVSGATDQYRLQVSNYSGTAGNAMSANSGRRFSTYDRDNDISSGHCARRYRSPWWHFTCSWSHLNGNYHFTRYIGSNEGSVNWYQWKNNWYSMKRAKMKVRRRC